MNEDEDMSQLAYHHELEAKTEKHISVAALVAIEQKIQSIDREVDTYASEKIVEVLTDLVKYLKAFSVK